MHGSRRESSPHEKTALARPLPRIGRIPCAETPPVEIGEPLHPDRITRIEAALDDRLVDAPPAELGPDAHRPIAPLDTRPGKNVGVAGIALIGLRRKLGQDAPCGLALETARRELLCELATAVLAPREQPDGRASRRLIAQTLTSSTTVRLSADAGNTLARTSRSISAARSG